MTGIKGVQCNVKCAMAIQKILHKNAKIKILLFQI